MYKVRPWGKPGPTLVLLRCDHWVSLRKPSIHRVRVKEKGLGHLAFKPKSNLGRKLHGPSLGGGKHTHQL